LCAASRKRDARLSRASCVTSALRVLRVLRPAGFINRVATTCTCGVPRPLHVLRLLSSADCIECVPVTVHIDTSTGFDAILRLSVKRIKPLSCATAGLFCVGTYVGIPQRTSAASRACVIECIVVQFSQRRLTADDFTRLHRGILPTRAGDRTSPSESVLRIPG
jgi:hypothetical protein